MIHERAVIDSSAKIGKNVVIGPWCVIEANVVIGDGCKIFSNSVIHRNTVMGKNNVIHPFVSLGGDPQDKKYEGEEAFAVIGDNNIFREGVTLNRGTKFGSGKTAVGNNNLFQAYSHIAHDCIIGNHVIFSNCATIAGHVEIEDHVILSGHAGSHQFCKIGRYSFIGMRCAVNQDVVPFSMVAGAEPSIRGINLVGLKRANWNIDDIGIVKDCFKIIFRSNMTVAEATKTILSKYDNHELAKEIVNFVMNSSRGILR